MARQFSMGDADRHFWITRSVAKVLGVSLTDAMARGDLTPEYYAELVTRCQMCGKASQCEAWLGRQLGGHADGPPQECINGQPLLELRRPEHAGDRKPAISSLTF